jgi:hypothetical protein
MPRLYRRRHRTVSQHPQPAAAVVDPLRFAASERIRKLNILFIARLGGFSKTSAEGGKNWENSETKEKTSLKDSGIRLPEQMMSPGSPIESGSRVCPVEANGIHQRKESATVNLRGYVYIKIKNIGYRK